MESRHGGIRRWPKRLRSWTRYGTSLRAKLVVLVLVTAVLVVGALYWFATASLRASITSIYEQRARSVAAVISRSIQEKDYILYYSDELDIEIDALQERYETVVGISVVGASARGFQTVSSTDPTRVGVLSSEEEQERFDRLRGVETETVQLEEVAYLRATHPIFDGADLIGVVVVDMSLDEQVRHITALTWRFGLASIVGFVLLGGLLYLALLSIVTRPIARLAGAIGSVAERKYDAEVSVPFRKIPGTPMRDEVSRLIAGFNLMTKVIHSHEQELMKLVVLDELTGAYTYDHLRSEVERELNKTRRYRRPTSILLIDVAGIEDRGVEEQESALVRTASFLVGNLRNVDVLFRVSESRFASLLPETPPEGASVAAERLRASVPDVTAQFPFSVRIEISHMGWGDEGAPPIEDVLRHVQPPVGEPGE